jgi:hypothetical protein
MYRLIPPTVRLDDNFIKEFIKKNVEKEEMQMAHLIKEWWFDPDSFKVIGDKIYHVPKLKKSPMLVSIMLCHLYGEKNSSKFKLGWVPLIHQVLAGNIFNWAHILSANLKQEVQKSQEAPPGYYPGFFMSSYLVDAICVVTPFPLLAWSWSPSEEAIHLYCSKMWEINCKNYFYDICNFFMIPLHFLLKNLPAPRFSQEAMDAIK